MQIGLVINKNLGIFVGKKTILYMKRPPLKIAEDRRTRPVPVVEIVLTILLIAGLLLMLDHYEIINITKNIKR